MPVTFAVVGDRIVVVIDGKPKSGRPLRRIRNIETNPRVSVLVDHYDEDWLQLWWARADGLARIVHAGPELAESVAVLRAKYPQYATMVATDGPAIAIDVDRWSGWEFRAQ